MPKGVLTWVRQPYWQKDAEGKCWLGRGYVQITHKANYLKLKGVTGADLTGNPLKAMEVPVALDIMFKGMKQGSFTGRKLAEFFSGPKEDWRSARKIINGLERADLVASYAKKYYSAISYTTG